MSEYRVTRVDVLKRGAMGRCPNCGEKSIFAPGNRFKVNPVCPNCGLKIEKGEGAFLGPFVINYGVAVFGFVIPLIAICVHYNVGLALTITAGAVPAFVLPLVLYRLSWSWWLMVYYYFLPQNLPMNLGAEGEDDE